MAWKAPQAVRTAHDVFVGYLHLDTLVGNTDRHNENWGLIEEPEEATARRHLAPTFDQASCLGCHLRDSERAERLKTRDRGFSVEAFAEKARSGIYQRVQDQRPLLTLDAFSAAVRKQPAAAAFWLGQMSRVSDLSIDALFAKVPPERMSPTAADFAKRLLRHNRDRISNLGTG